MKATRIILAVAVAGLVSLGTLALAESSDAAPKPPAPPIFHDCNVITGAHLVPASYTLPRDPGIKWWVETGQVWRKGVAPGTYTLPNTPRPLTVVIFAVRGKNKFVHEWAHSYGLGVCASLNPVPHPLPPGGFHLPPPTLPHP